MSAAKQREENLPDAVLHLRRAIDALIEPRQEIIEGKRRVGPSLYVQLWDAAPLEQITGRRELSATAVTWIEALRLRIEIDQRIELEQPMFRGVPPTVGRLREIAKRGWKPSQARYVDRFAGALQDWAKEIEELLNPQPQWTLAAECPNCGQAIVYGTDSAGERVRKPALSIGPQGCVCQRCRTVWTPDQFLFLARVLGYEPPAGVLE